MASTSPVPEPYDLRASDGERDAVVEALRGHAAAGRIDAEELELRLERAYAAPLRADLLPLVADLPAPERQQAARSARRAMPAVAPLISLAILLVAIWALTGAGYFWPMWPIGGVAIGALKHRRWHYGAPPVQLVRTAK